MRTAFLCMLLSGLLAGSVAFASLDQGGDNCSDIVWITSIPYSDIGSTVGRSNDYEFADSCAPLHQSTAPDVIYGFVPSRSAVYTISTCGSSFRTILSILTGGACPGATPVGCTAIGCPDGSGASTNKFLSEGVTYYIIVDGWRTFSGAYAFSVAETPCQNIPMTAPGTFSGTTCGNGNNCTFVQTEDKALAVTIPTTDDWMFELCNSPSNWTPYFILSAGCCDAQTILLSGSPLCGMVGMPLPVFRQYLTAGTYYVTIEGDTTWHGQGGCGEFSLNVRLSRGRCCYEDNLVPYCASPVGPTSCHSLSGVYDEGVTCNTPCPVFPHCPTQNEFSQLPLMPEECAHCWETSEVGQWQLFDSFHNVTEPIGTLRFWGILHQFNAIPDSLREDPPMRISFYSDSSGVRGALVNQYDLNLYGIRQNTYYHDAYGYLRSREFTTELDPPCTLTNGWISIQGAGDPNINFFWLASSESPARWAFCLGASCKPADSLTMNYSPDFHRLRLDFYSPQASNYKLMASTNPAALEPGDFQFVRWVTAVAGHNSITEIETEGDFCAYQLLQDCTAPRPSETATLSGPATAPKPVRE